MSNGTVAEAGGNPFSARMALVLVVLGTLVFVALLWMIGAGMTSGSTNDGGGHAGGKGLNGYAAAAAYLERRGYTVRLSRSKGVFDDPGLLVLTPPQWADGEELDRIVSQRRYIGPTLIVTPKWMAFPSPTGTPGAKQGWVRLDSSAHPRWKGFLDDVGVEIGPVGKNKTAVWQGEGLDGNLPDAETVLWGTGPRLVPLVSSRVGGRILAAYIDDDGDYPDLESMALQPIDRPGEDYDLSPIAVIFEPDLLNNFGFSDASNARMAEVLVRAMAEGGNGNINFDLTFNGHARSANLLTLAFTPPFLAATLCLLLAGLAIGWRAFLRFGPPRKVERAIALGKKALVANAAGLLRRARRLHLIGGPYIERARERIAHDLALPRGAGREATDAAIDLALASRAPDSTSFTELARRLRSAQSPHEIVKAAQDLHDLERKLTR
ncbi:MAG: DUF4350 domain-containing protein [Novosphingobium sp.]|nr:DUF4350 domain-containing protein [Novosphingobium sp.]